MKKIDWKKINWKKIVCGIVVVLLFLGWTYLSYYVGERFPFSKIECTSTKITPFDFWSLVVDICVAVGTIGAVIVSIFHDKIRRFFNAPKAYLSLCDGGIYENINLEVENPSADSYICYLTIENISRINIHSAKVCINDYSHKNKNNWKKDTKAIITNLQLKSKLLEIPTETTEQVKLFEIKAPVNMPGDTNVSAPEIKFNGINSPIKNNNCKINYYLQYNREYIQKFELIVEWNGVWKSRKSEMQDCLTINFKEIK